MTFIKHGGNFVNLVGKKFNRLTVVSFVGSSNGSRHSMWECLCVCGGKCIVTGTSLRSGQISCGCARVEYGKSKKTHGEANPATAEYRAYFGAKNRCTNTNCPKYRGYGGRGVKFLFDSYEDFLKEVGRKPNKSFVLDRIDVNGNYEIGNLRWSSPKESSLNIRTRPETILLKDGRWASQVAKEKGIPESTWRNRIRRGWSVESSVNC